MGAMCWRMDWRAAAGVRNPFAFSGCLGCVSHALLLQGAYCSSSAAVRAERVAGEKYDAGGAIAKLTTYYSSSGARARALA